MNLIPGPFLACSLVFLILIPYTILISFRIQNSYEKDSKIKAKNERISMYGLIISCLSTIIFIVAFVNSTIYAQARKVLIHGPGRTMYDRGYPDHQIVK